MIARGWMWNLYFILLLTRPWWWTNLPWFFTRRGKKRCSTRILYSINDRHVTAINHLFSLPFLVLILVDRRSASQRKTSTFLYVARDRLPPLRRGEKGIRGKIREMWPWVCRIREAHVPRFARGRIDSLTNEVIVQAVLSIGMQWASVEERRWKEEMRGGGRERFEIA